MMITLEQIQKLHEEELHSNVKILISFLFSLPELQLPLEDEYSIVAKKYQLLVYYGDSFYNEECYKRAETQYSEAIKLRKQLLKLKPKSQTVKITPENEVKYKLYLCYMKLNESKQALAILEGIAPKYRTLKINMILAKLYKKHGMERSAITCYKEVLRASPIAVEAATALLNLGVTLQEVNYIMLGTSSSTTPPDWLAQYLKGYSFSSINKHSKAIPIFKSLESQILKDNVNILCTLGESHYHNGDNHTAICCYEKVRLLNKQHLEGMDLYAQILAEEKQKDNLERLAQELTETNDNRTESWLAMSHYCACINQTTKAVYFAQKAHMIDTTNVPALMLKASLLFALNKQHEAIIHYREAIRLSPTQLKPYGGLVDCYISSEKYKEALNVARNAHKTVGANARTVTLCAKVYALEPQTQEKAKTMLQKALANDSTYLPAVYLLVDILMKQDDNEAASKFLSKQLEIHQTSKLYCLYALCLKQLGREECMEMYNKALRLDPDNSRALEGLQNVTQDSAADLDMSSIGLHEPRHRSSLEGVDSLGADMQWID